MSGGGERRLREGRQGISVLVTVSRHRCAAERGLHAVVGQRMKVLHRGKRIGYKTVTLTSMGTAAVGRVSRAGLSAETDMVSEVHTNHYCA